jgi:hypothetical protein
LYRQYLTGLDQRRLACGELTADAQLDAAEAHVVLDDALRDGAKVELRGALEAYAAELSVQIDLRGGAVPALEELLETQQFFVSGSTLQLDLEEREVRRGRHEVAARCETCCGDEACEQDRSVRRSLHD